jgi:hypothetical protein
MNVRLLKMKTRAFLVLLPLAFSVQPSALRAQGSLTPPGPPAPTMKSLDQVEPRTAITNSSAVTISQPGSYYLTRNIAVSTGDAVTIATNNVTLDLNGFTISSTDPAAAFKAIALAGNSEITIRNGFIQGGVTNNTFGVYSGSGFGYGISYSGQTPVDVRVADVSISGCLDSGIFLSTVDRTIVERCMVRTAGGYGIVAWRVSDSTAENCGSTAISAEMVSDCYGAGNGTADGIDATTVDNSFGYSPGGFGIGANSTHNCYGGSVSGIGIASSVAENCFGNASGSGSYGISADNTQNCNGTGGSVGIRTSSTAIGCFGSGTDYGINAGLAQMCQGYTGSGSGDGVYAYTVQNSFGYNGGNGFGVYAYDQAFLSYGSSTSGTGLRAFIANSCDGTSLSVTFKYNMP